MTEAKTALIDLGRPNPERWYMAWRAGDLAVPFQSCSAAQAYRVYKRWATIQGEKFTSAANYFSRQVLREAKDAITVQVARVGLGSGQTTRMWLVAPPTEGMNMGVFASGCVDAFEAHLVKYTGENQ